MSKRFHPFTVVFPTLTLSLSLSLSLGIGCGGSSSPTTPASLPVSVEGPDGSTDVATDSSFQYTFTKAADSTTVTTSTYFIVATPSSDLSAPLSLSLTKQS